MDELTTKPIHHYLCDKSILKAAGSKKVRGAASALAGADRTFLGFLVLFC